MDSLVWSFPYDIKTEGQRIEWGALVIDWISDSLLHFLMDILKFIYSEKATIFRKIFTGTT